MAVILNRRGDDGPSNTEQEAKHNNIVR